MNILWAKTREKIGGWGGIRTHETLSGLPVFKTGAFNRSATHPALPVNVIENSYTGNWPGWLFNATRYGIFLLLNPGIMFPFGSFGVLCQWQHWR